MEEMGKDVTASVGSDVRFECRLVRLASLRPHEEVIPERVELVRQDILDEGAVLEPVLVEERYNIILNGHHRVQALRLLGAGLVPAYVLPYERAFISVKVHPESSRSEVTKQDVIEAGLSGRLMPPHTSFHVVSIPLEKVRTPLSRLKEEPCAG